MERVIDRCAGLDVHHKTVVACVRVPGPSGERQQHVQTFGTMTADLLALRDWLSAHQVTHVAMESTGVYWKPVYYALEDAFTVLLVNAAHMRNVPGRKTDVKDGEWIAQLLEHGLLRGSFVPPPPIRELRDLTRYRKTLIQERGREVQRLQKVLEDAGVKLSAVASDIVGVSGRAMLDALVHGTTDPEVLAELARGRLRAKLPALQQALTGRFDRHHRVLVSQMLAHLDYLEEAVATLSREIEATLRPFGEAGYHPWGEPAHGGSIDCRDRSRHESLSHRGPFGQLGRPVSRPPRQCGQAQIGEDPQGQPVVADRLDGGRLGRDQKKGLCAGRTLSPDHAASRS